MKRCSGCSNRARSVILLALGCARRRGAANIEPGGPPARPGLATAELSAGSAAPMEWLGSDHPPFFPDDVSEKLLRASEDTPKGDPAAKDDMRFRALKKALVSAAKIAQERDSDCGGTRKRVGATAPRARRHAPDSGEGAQRRNRFG
jgi:hypothetical protein